jgi:hypothetical protein
LPSPSLWNNIVVNWMHGRSTLPLLDVIEQLAAMYCHKDRCYPISSAHLVGGQTLQSASQRGMFSICDAVVEVTVGTVRCTNV